MIIKNTTIVRVYKRWESPLLHLVCLWLIIDVRQVQNAQQSPLCGVMLYAVASLELLILVFVRRID